MQKNLALVVALLCAMSAVAKAGPVIKVGAHSLLPNTPGQTIPIFVGGDNGLGWGVFGVGKVQGMDFQAVIGDGGATFGGTDNLVPLMNADIVTGTIFSAHAVNASNQNPGHVYGLGLAAWEITTTSGAVDAVGLAGTLIVDTTGFASGAWPLNMNVFDLVVTDFGEEIMPTTVINGSITIVPEPASLVLGLFAAAGLTAFAIRRTVRRRPS